MREGVDRINSCNSPLLASLVLLAVGCGGHAMSPALGAAGGTSSIGGGDAGIQSSGGGVASGGINESSGSGGAAAGAAFPSCAGLPANCGSSSNDNCCASPTVTGGTFKLGGMTGTTSATVATFALDKYE